MEKINLNGTLINLKILLIIFYLKKISILENKKTAS